MSTAELLGAASIGGFMPTTLTAVGAAMASLQLPLIDLEAQIAGALAASASISIQPPSIDLSAAIASSLTLPGVAIDISAMASLVGSLNLKLAQIQASLGLLLGLSLSLGGSAGVYAWKLEGEVAKMGPDWSSQIAGGIPGIDDPKADGLGIILLAQESSSVAALRSVFGL